MIAAGEGTAASFELSLSHDLSLVATVRRFVGELSKRILVDPDVASRVAVAAHELIDNAVRHASDDESRVKVTLRRTEAGGEVEIVTMNRASEERGAQVERLLEEMQQKIDRGAIYQTLLRRAARRTEGSGLGLGRVHAESELDLTGRFEEGVVHVRAEGRFEMNAPTGEGMARP